MSENEQKPRSGLTDIVNEVLNQETSEEKQEPQNTPTKKRRGRPNKEIMPVSEEQIKLKSLMKKQKLSIIRKQEAEQQKRLREENTKKAGLFDRYLNGELTRDEILLKGFVPPTERRATNTEEERVKKVKNLLLLLNS